MAPTGQDHGAFPLTLIPNWEFIHHFADLAVIGSFLLSIALLYFAPPQTRTPLQITDNDVTQPTGRLSVLRFRRPTMLALAFVFAFLTIALFVYTKQPAPLDVHLATAYWYRIELDKLTNL
jgi:hypothetical protein